MSAGNFIPEIYQTNDGTPYPVRVQPETLTLTLNSQANVGGTGPVAPNTPSAKVSAGRNELGVICRLVRFRFNTATIPPGYQQNSILTLPVLTTLAFNAWSKGAVGTYTLNGTDYDVAFVGKTPEKIN